MAFTARFGFAFYCGSFTTCSQCELDALPWHCSSQKPFGQDWEKSSVCCRKHVKAAERWQLIPYQNSLPLQPPEGRKVGCYRRNKQLQLDSYC